MLGDDFEFWGSRLTSSLHCEDCWGLTRFNALFDIVFPFYNGVIFRFRFRRKCNPVRSSLFWPSLVPLLSRIGTALIWLPGHGFKGPLIRIFSFSWRFSSLENLCVCQLRGGDGADQRDGDRLENWLGSWKLFVIYCTDCPNMRWYPTSGKNQLSEFPKGDCALLDY